jgi:hypothetical protein
MTKGKCSEAVSKWRIDLGSICSSFPGESQRQQSTHPDFLPLPSLGRREYYSNVGCVVCSAVSVVGVLPLGSLTARNIQRAAKLTRGRWASQSTKDLFFLGIVWWLHRYVNRGMMRPASKGIPTNPARSPDEISKGWEPPSSLEASDWCWQHGEATCPQPKLHFKSLFHHLSGCSNYWLLNNIEDSPS